MACNGPLRRDQSEKKKRWRYHPGDVVEVRGLDMRWHMGVVTFARGFQDESREEKHTRIKERLSRASSQLLTRKASQSEAEEVVNENADNGDDDMTATKKTTRNWSMSCARTVASTSATTRTRSEYQPTPFVCYLARHRSSGSRYEDPMLHPVKGD